MGIMVRGGLDKDSPIPKEKAAVWMLYEGQIFLS